MKMPMISIRRTRSFKSKHARIDIQKGFVWRMIQAVLIGSRVTAQFIKAKEIYPARDLIIKSFSSDLGKPLNGFCFLILTCNVASPPIQTFLKKHISMTDTPSLATCLKRTP